MRNKKSSTAFLASALFFLLFPFTLSAQKKFFRNDSVIARPDLYVYGEGFGPAGAFSINAEKQLYHTHSEKRGLYARLGAQWLPDHSVRYNMAGLGGFCLDSGTKNWARNFGGGMVFLVDHYNWQKSDTLSTHALANKKHSTLEYGPYVSLGFRYRFGNDIFLGFEFTPLCLKGDAGWQIIPRVGLSAGFLFDRKK